MSTRQRLPGNAVLELTYCCNHKCLFCSCPWENTSNPSQRYEKHDELVLEEWKRVFHTLEASDVMRVSISGGEPLLKHCLVDLLYYIREHTKLSRDEKIVLISNGEMMSENLLAVFKELDIHLSLSLPGLTTFEYHTGSDTNSPSNVLKWLSRAKESLIDTTVNITVTDKNYHELYETIANGLIAGADTVLLNRVLYGGRGVAYHNELTLSEEKLRGMLDTAEEVLSKSKRIGSLGTEYPLCLISEKIGKSERLRMGSKCAAAKDFFVIDPSGYVRTCNHSPRRVGYIFDDDIISDKVYWDTFAKGTYSLPKMCNGCEYIQNCDCGCREAASIYYDSLSAPDPCFSHYP